MKKQVARTITTLSLFVVLSVGASHVSAFPRCAGLCRPAVRYAAAAPAQNAHAVPVQDTLAVNAPSAGIGSLDFWAELAMFFARLI